MQKIFNWTVGSFFRSIGRIIAYLVVGGLIAYLLSSNDFRIEDLFLEKVNASSYSTFWPNNVQFTDSGRQNYASVSLNNDFYSIARTINGWASPGYFKFDQVQLNSNAKDLYVNFRVTKITADNIDMDYSNFSCTIDHDLDNFNSSIYGNAQGSYDYNLYDFTGVDCEFEDLNGQIRQANYVIGLKYWVNNNEDLAGSCYLLSQASGTLTFKCPIASNNISGFRYTFYSRDNSNYYLGFSPYLTYDYDESQAIINAQNQTTQSINSQTQQQQQQHNELMDDNTTQADSEGQDFINNFSNNTHGLTGIITAPLNAIQSLASATCSSLVLPLPFTNNKTLTLPCMSTIYSTHFGAFYTMYQGIILALISYWVCVRLFTLAKGFKDPDDDKIEVVDL